MFSLHRFTSQSPVVAETRVTRNAVKFYGPSVHVIFERERKKSDACPVSQTLKTEHQVCYIFMESILKRVCLIFRICYGSTREDPISVVFPTLKIRYIVNKVHNAPFI